MFVDIQIREHEHGDIIYTGNGKIEDELAHIIEKYGIEGEVTNKIMELRKPQITE